MKISVILPVLLLIGVLCFVGGYVLKEAGWSLTAPTSPSEQSRDNFIYRGPFVNVDTQDGVIHIGRRSMYQIGWDHGSTGKPPQLDEYQRGYDAGKTSP